MLTGGWKTDQETGTSVCLLELGWSLALGGLPLCAGLSMAAALAAASWSGEGFAGRG